MNYAIEIVVRCYLHNPPEVHDGNSIAHMLHHSEVMGYDDVGEIEIFLQAVKQIDNLCLNRYVQCGDRFVCQQQLWIKDQCPGNSYPLTLASAEETRGDISPYALASVPLSQGFWQPFLVSYALLQFHEPQEGLPRYPRPASWDLGRSKISGKIICISLRNRRIVSESARQRSVPLKRISPSSGSISLKISLHTVDFPQPLSPTSPKVSFSSR